MPILPLTHFADCTMTNIQNICRPKMVGSVPKSNLCNPIKIISQFIGQSCRCRRQRGEPPQTTCAQHRPAECHPSHGGFYPTRKEIVRSGWKLWRTLFEAQFAYCFLLSHNFTDGNKEIFVCGKNLAALNRFMKS